MDSLRDSKRDTKNLHPIPLLNQAEDLGTKDMEMVEVICLFSPEKAKKDLMVACRHLIEGKVETDYTHRCT